MRMIHCHKLKQEHPQLPHPPFPGEIGERIYREISQVAWDQWIIEQTKIINEYRLDPMDEKAQILLHDEMMSFLFK